MSGVWLNAQVLSHPCVFAMCFQSPLTRQCVAIPIFFGCDEAKPVSNAQFPATSVVNAKSTTNTFFPAFGTTFLHIATYAHIFLNFSALHIFWGYRTFTVVRTSTLLLVLPVKLIRTLVISCIFFCFFVYIIYNVIDKACTHLCQSLRSSSFCGYIRCRVYQYIIEICVLMQIRWR